MPEKGIRSTYSQSPFQIIMSDDQGIISTGTAFYYCVADEWFLITNWHNISGKHFNSKEPIDQNKRLPTYIEAKLATYDNSHEGNFSIRPHKIEIYKDNKPLWYEHPRLGSTCDVIALPIKKTKSCPEFMHNAVNLIDNIRIPIKPGNTVFIIGYPKSISVGFGLPLWKSGYIASEPYYDVTIGGELSKQGGMKNGVKLPAFFVDSQTREGMSGSPIFASYVGSWDSANPYETIDFDAPNFFTRNDVFLGSEGVEFVGCYSARIGSREDGAALGLCWCEGAIKEICEAKNAAQHPHVK